MTHLLLVYRRSTGDLIYWKDLGDDRPAAARFRAERERLEKDDTDIEVVVLSATDRQAIMKTHARYFRRELRQQLQRSSEFAEPSSPPQ